jgi:tetratricopeptide (TPR) repeat protein
MKLAPKLILMTTFLAGCSFLGSVREEIKINSSPEGAEISYASEANRDFKSIGMTPLSIGQKQIRDWKGSGLEYIALKLQKPGHASETIILDLKNRYHIKYEAELKPIDIWHNKEEEVSSSAANKLAVKIQAINQYIFDKDLGNALKTTESLIEQFPKAHVFFDIKGSILYLMGKKTEALSSYQKSLSLNPDNTSTQEMIKKVNGAKQ